MDRMGYEAVRTARYTYIRYTDLKGMDELYDLDADPYQMHNVIDAPALRATLRELQDEVDRLRRATP